ncbi:MAG: AI-2E family transporter [Gammaproteobacteria bacterium]
MEAISSWFKRYTSDPQVVALALVLLVGMIIIVTMGRMLAPALAALVFAFLLEGAVGALVRRGVPRNLSVTLIFLLFLFVLIFMLLGVLPELSHQITQLVQQLPSILTKGQGLVMQLPEKYPDLINQEQIETIIDSIRSQIAAFGQRVLSVSLASVVDLVTIMVYIILVPVLIFFFLKDKLRIADWLKSYLPKDRALTDLVWSDVNTQIGNYVRGKIWEIFLVGGVSYITFLYMDLQYAVLLGTLVGLSVVIPYIGAAVVTLPIAAIAYFQWGWSAEFGYVILAYGIIQALDGNVLVPLLFSEVVDLHPIAIILSVLVFGGIWGVWGIFFAIPLATVVQAVLKAWPRSSAPQETEAEQP